MRALGTIIFVTVQKNSRKAFCASPCHAVRVLSVRVEQIGVALSRLVQIRFGTGWIRWIV